MHMSHGNTAGVGDALVKLRVCNIAGLQQHGRSEFLAEHTVDFMAVTETHANAYTQKSFVRELQEHAVLFGEPVRDRGFAGVAFMYRKSSAWSVKAVPFISGKCERFYSDARLLCVQIFRSSERRSIIVYVICGKSGARWEADKKEYNKQLLRAVHEDSIQRGDIATIVCGDFNLTVNDAPEEVGLYQKSRWVDAAIFGIHGFDDRPTSLKGTGARIDLAFFNQTASVLAKGYDLLEGINSGDHRMLDLTLVSPIAAQFWYMTKRIGSAEAYSKPSESYIAPHVSTDHHLRAKLLQGDLDGAFDLWCRRAEGLLSHIPLVGGGYDWGNGRGKTSLRRMTVLPPEGVAGADTVRCRKLAKAMRQLQELDRMNVWAYRAELTIAHLKRFVNEEKGDFGRIAQPLLRDTLTRDKLGQLQKLVGEEYTIVGLSAKMRRNV